MQNSFHMRPKRMKMPMNKEDVRAPARHTIVIWACEAVSDGGVGQWPCFIFLGSKEQLPFQACRGVDLSHV